VIKQKQSFRASTEQINETVHDGSVRFLGQDGDLGADDRDAYALRKQTPEPVFGIIKSVLGFRQFLLRGLDKVRGEWSLVTMAWNIKRMFILSAA
jgi:hypothetical protein